MKYLVMALLIVLAGCSLEPEYQTALNNYSKDTCKGKLLSVATLTTDGTLSSEMWFNCIEDTGVVRYSVVIKNIPQKYWELE